MQSPSEGVDMFEDLFVLQATIVPHGHQRDLKLSSTCLKTSAYHHLICVIFSHVTAFHFVCIEALNKLSGTGIMETFERNLKPTDVKDCSRSK
jgi:hypothetical protein